MALALLGNTLPTGAMLVVLILIFGPVSGAHINPAVSLAFALRRELSLWDLIGYVGAQLGGVGGASDVRSACVADFNSRAQPAVPMDVGRCGDVACAHDLRLRGARPGRRTLRSAYMTAAYWFTASTSFANPAVTIARALSDTFAGSAAHRASRLSSSPS